MPPNTRRQLPRRTPSNNPSFIGWTRPGEQPPPEDGEETPEPAHAGFSVELLDPKIIVWPQGRITSEYDEERAAELQRSMAEIGQQDAVGVYLLEDGTYEGAAGYNRCRAAIESGAETIVCVVKRGSHRDVVISNLATALNQSRPNPMSEVEGVAHAYHEEGISLEELCSITGKSPGWVEDRLAIWEASPALHQFLREGRIGLGHAAVLARIEDHQLQEEFLHLCMIHNWSVEQLKEQIRGQQPPEPGDGDEEDQSPKRPRTRRQSEPVETTALSCNYCERRQEEVQVQIIYLCDDCAASVKGPADDCAASVKGPAEEGQISIPAGLLREAGLLLAGIQAGSAIAERIASYLEEAGH